MIVLIDEDLRNAVAQEIREMQKSHPRSSIAGDIAESRFEETVDFVCKVINLSTTDDLNTAVIIGLAKAKHDDLSRFIKRKKNPYPPKFAINWK